MNPRKPHYSLVTYYPPTDYVSEAPGTGPQHGTLDGRYGFVRRLGELQAARELYDRAHPGRPAIGYVIRRGSYSGPIEAVGCFAGDSALVDRIRKAVS